MYTEYIIGDGDSSVHCKLVEKLPWGLAIKKNWSLQIIPLNAFYASLESLVSTKSRYKSRGN